MRKILFAFLGGMFLNVCAVFVAEGRTLDCGEPVSGECRAGCFYDGASGSCIRCPAGTYRVAWGSEPCKDCTKPSEIIEIKGEYEFEFLNGDEYTGYDTDTCPWLIRCSAGRYWRYSEISKTAYCYVCGGYGSTTSDPDERCYDFDACNGGDCDVIGQKRVDYNDNVYIEVNTTDNNEYACKPKVYTMTLNKNTNLTELNGKIYENKKMTVSCNDDSINAKAYLQPTQPVKIFSGYATESNTCNKEIFNEDGNLVVYPDFFDSDKTLYACWDNPNITIYYYFEDPGETMKKQTCRVDDTKTEVDCNFEDYSGAGSAGKYFNGFSCMYKQENGVLAACSNDPDEIYEIGEPIPLLGTEIYVKILFSDCPAGYYCEDSNLLVECPIGTTSDAASSSIEDCYMPSGQSGTKFCDKNGCFYLPTGIGNISYNPS